MTPLLAAVALAASAGTLTTLAVPSAAHAAPPTCDGKPATIVSDKDRGTVRGTDGDDVIVVTGGDVQIFGGPGADTICNLGGSGNQQDRLIDTGDEAEAEAGLPLSHDVVIDTYVGTETRPGISSGAPGEINDDDITANYATVATLGIPTGDLSSTGGFLYLESGEVPSAYALDTTAGTVTTDGQTASIDGFARFQIPRDNFTDVQFSGSGAAEELVLAFYADGADPVPGQQVDLMMRGGRDTVLMAPGTSGSVRTGHGFDTLNLIPERDQPRVDVSIPDNTVTTDPSGAVTAISGLNAYEVDAETATFVGGDSHEQIGIHACTADVRGGGGDDLILSDRSVTFSGCVPDLQVRGGDGDDRIYNRFASGQRNKGYTDDHFYGNDGDDRLYGSRGSDTLIGGPGDDVAVGGSAGAKDETDTCEAEKRVNCEK